MTGGEKAGEPTAPDEIAIDIRGLHKSFGPKRIYAGLDLAIRRAETFTVLGASGAGKSVLLKLIIGLLKPDAGQILVEGTDVVPLNEQAMREVRRKVGMLFQGSALFDSLSVSENVAYGLWEHYRWSSSRMRARVAECLAWVGLGGIEEMRPAELSGGMKKRVGLARALAPGPDVILYDEPTTGLDPANTRRILELIASLQKRLGVTSVVITHDIESALAVSNRIGLLERGHLSLIATAAEAARAPASELQAFMRGEPEGEADGR